MAVCDQMSVVTCEVTMTCVDAAGRCGDVEAAFHYDPALPFGMVVVFRTDDEVVPWTFARDLLARGRYEPTGAGDVLVHPGLDERERAVTVLLLQSPEGFFVAQVRTSELDAFLHRTFDLVPEGSEAGLLDLDAELSALLRRSHGSI